MATREKLLDELLKDCKAPGDLFGQDGFLKQFTKDLVERILEAELSDIWATRNTLQRVEVVAIPVMAPAIKHSKATRAK